ncbi:MAG: cobyrinate a,c-diamide synthase [Burkholderiales bacterium]|nr:cobyrinate a,c-diamide synthase [Burkholderiales bacterium]
MNTPRLLVSAAHKSSGKTTVTLGLAAAWAAQGLTVQCFKKGPDYIDPMWLALASGRSCYNLDPHLSERAAIEQRVAQSAAGADLALVEGNKGLYDGLSLDGSNSNAALAKMLGAPVLLVLDARGMTRGIAPLILGYQAFDRDIRIAGVVLNRVGGARHESKLRAVIEHYTDVPVLGAVAENPRLALAERHLGLLPCVEHEGAAAWVAEVARIVGAQVDLARVRGLAAAAKGATVATVAASAAVPAAPIAAPRRERSAPPARGTGDSRGPRESCDSPDGRLRIGIARDRAFGFYYPDDLDALRAGGADLVFIDTLHDQRLPPLDGLFVGGGFPETCAEALEDNPALRGALREAVVGGLPTYAECGGLMLMARSIRWRDHHAEMVDVIAGDAVMHERPVGRGYVQLEETEAMPWPASAGQPALATARGHEFHHASLEGLPPGQRFAWRVQRGHGIDGRHDGLVVHNLLASFSHLRHGAGAFWVDRFLAHVRAIRAERDERDERDVREGGAPRAAQPARAPKRQNARSSTLAPHGHLPVAPLAPADAPIA